MRRTFLVIFTLILSHRHVLAQPARRGQEELRDGDTTLVNRYLQTARRWEALNHDSASHYYGKAKTLAVSIGDRKGAGDAYVQLFLGLFKESRYEEALSVADEEVTLGDKWKDDGIRMKGYNNLAIAYQYLSDYQTATTYYLKAAAFADKMGDRLKEAKIFDNMASLFLSLKDYKTAYSYGLHEYELSRERQDTLYMISGLTSAGAAESGLKKYQAALQHFEQGEALAYQTHNMIKAATILTDKGMLRQAMNDLPAATMEFKKAIGIADQWNIPYIRMISLNGLSQVEMALGNYKKADRQADEAIALGEKLHLSAELAEMYNQSASIKQKLGKLSQSLLYKNRYEKINDSLMNVQIRTNINRLNIQYHTVQKDKEILQQKLQLAQNQVAIQRKNAWILLFTVGLSALILILVVSFRNYRNKKKLHGQTVLALQKEQEVIRLRALMEGKDQERRRIAQEMHDDIGAGLTTILFLSNRLTQDAVPGNRHTGEKIVKNANGLIGKMNEIIWSMNTEYDTLEDLLAYIRHNAGELLDSMGLQYHFHIPDAIPVIRLSGEQRRNIYLVVKESLHNIIKHAGATKVDIRFRSDPAICISVQDDGKGLDGDRSNRFGNGLKNMRQRMMSIGGELEILTDQGTEVRLTLPLTR